MATLPLSGTYSFLDVQCGLVSPQASFTLSENGIAEEGITIAMAGPKQTRTMGADGTGMLSLHASNAANVTIRLLKVSPINAMLNALYREQMVSSASWGGIQITVGNPVLGDNIVCQLGGFTKQADVPYATDGGIMTWEFEFISVSEMLGNGYNPNPV
jgi:hypothetical protein